MGKSGYDWAAIAADPRYCALQQRKTRLLAWLLFVAVAGYFLLSVGAALFPHWFAIRISGAVNLGIVLAFSQFAMVFAAAVFYTMRANRDFDQVAAEIDRVARESYRRPR